MQQLKDKNIGNLDTCFTYKASKLKTWMLSLLFFGLFVCFFSVCQLHTQDIHATLELEGLLDNELRFLGDVSHQPLSSGIDILHSHLHLFSDCLDLNTIRNSKS